MRRVIVAIAVAVGLLVTVPRPVRAAARPSPAFEEFWDGGTWGTVYYHCWQIPVLPDFHLETFCS